MLVVLGQAPAALAESRQAQPAQVLQAKASPEPSAPGQIILPWTAAARALEAPTQALLSLVVVVCLVEAVADLAEVTRPYLSKLRVPLAELLACLRSAAAALLELLEPFQPQALPELMATATGVAVEVVAVGRP